MNDVVDGLVEYIKNFSNYYISNLILIQILMKLDQEIMKSLKEF